MSDFEEGVLCLDLDLKENNVFGSSKNEFMITYYRYNTYMINTCKYIRISDIRDFRLQTWVIKGISQVYFNQS